MWTSSCIPKRQFYKRNFSQNKFYRKSQPNEKQRVADMQICFNLELNERGTANEICPKTSQISTYLTYRRASVDRNIPDKCWRPFLLTSPALCYRRETEEEKERVGSELSTAGTGIQGGRPGGQADPPTRAACPQNRATRVPAVPRSGTTGPTPQQQPERRVCRPVLQLTSLWMRNVSKQTNRMSAAC